MTDVALERVLLDAFAGVPKPAQQDLVSHRCCECDEVAAALFPFPSDAVPAPVLARQVWDLPLLSDDGKHYYLLAWLRPGGESAVDAVLFALDSDHRWKPTPPYAAQEWLAVDHWLASIAQRDASLAEDIPRVRQHLPR